jgi:hypothetical protein
MGKQRTDLTTTARKKLCGGGGKVLPGSDKLANRLANHDLVAKINPGRQNGNGRSGSKLQFVILGTDPDTRSVEVLVRSNHGRQAWRVFAPALEEKKPGETITKLEALLKGMPELVVN